MTEKKWLACREPYPMIAFLDARCLAEEDENTTEWPLARKLRLFAIACCRHIEHLLTDQRSRDALAIIERWVEGEASEKEKQRAAFTASRVTWDYEELADGRLQAACAVCSTIEDIQEDFTDTTNAAEEAAKAVWCASGDPESASGYKQREKAFQAEEAYQAALVRDIFGNPFRPVAFDPAWRTSDVLLLARGIYEERAFDRMPILADALQDAGCDSPDLLGHLRDPQQTHVRGCWALDLVLGKE